MGLFGKVKKAVKKTGKRLGSDAKRTYKATAGKAIRKPDVSPRKAYKAAKRVVTSPFKVTRTLKAQTAKAKKARPRRRR